MPWQGLYFFRNIGSNKQPRFASPIRLYAASGKRGQIDFFDDFYTFYDVYDWFGNGRPDVITISRDGGIKVYKNAGEMDEAGLPRLELALTMDRPSCLAPGMYTTEGGA